MPRSPTQVVQLKLRIQERLRREVERRAKKSGRSLNGELASLIETAIAMESFGDIAENLKEQVGLLERQLREQVELMERLRDKSPKDGPA